MPWWGWPSSPRTNARPHVWMVLLAPHGSSGKEAHWQVLSMPYFQGQAAQGPTRKHFDHTPLRAHPPWLPVLGTWERPRRGCSSGSRSFYLVHPSLCYTIPDHPDNIKALWDNFIVHYVLPKKMFSDQGRNFESQLVADLCKLMGTQK